MESLAPENLAHRWLLDKGEVALLGYFGDDKMIADTARVSYRKGTKQTSSDKQLIRYLVRNKHTSPLEHATIRFYIKAPLFVVQQLLRHRTFKFNQSSARYSEMLNEAYLPDASLITSQDAKNKQARTELAIAESQDARDVIETGHDVAFNDYNNLLSKGVARELARVNLPHGTYSELIVTCDLHNLLHFLALRLNPHAQLEIRVYAEAMLEFIEGLFPATIEAWRDCSLNSFTLTGTMIGAMEELLEEWGDERYRVGGDSTSSNSRVPLMSFEDVLKHVCDRRYWASKSERDQFEQWALTKLQGK